MEDGGRAAAMSTISDQLAVPDSPGLRDLLKAHNSIRRRRRRRLADKRYSSSTAAAEASSLRTLHEILRDGEEGSGGSRERLRRRRRPDAAESTIPVAPLPPDHHHHDHSMDPFVTLEVILAEHRPEMSMEEEEEQPPVRVSLMALLEQTELGIQAAAMEEEGDGRLSRCCVCMTRAKGAAFIPCGHTFCRPCARELMKRRPCCPLCNADIHQILKIY